MIVNTFKRTDFVIIQSYSHNEIKLFKKHNLFLQILLLYHVVIKGRKKKKKHPNFPQYVFSS